MRTFDVLLGDVLAGYLVDDESGQVAFQTAPAYRALAQRPVLGQQFEDDLGGTFEGEPGRLPSFFANLVPEGPVRDLIVRSTGVPARDDLALLSAVGTDLPGAVVIRPSGERPPFSLGAPAVPAPGPASDVEVPPMRLRFSVAGVQMKFSVLRDGEKVALPVHDDYGDWLLKLDSPSISGLVANEFATMEWARAAGFEVPHCEVIAPGALPDQIRSLDPPDQPAFLIGRYDRGPGRRIHQEDMAQVLGLYPECKYGRQEQAECPPISYTQILSVLRGLGRDLYVEGIRRLALMVATGNDDAHLKNWSLFYPDGARPQLSPLYDQVAIAAWRGATMDWALAWNGVRNKAKRTTATTIPSLAGMVGESRAEAANQVQDVLESLVEAWPGVAALYPNGHAEAIRRYWREVPLLRPLTKRLSRSEG